MIRSWTYKKKENMENINEEKCEWCGALIYMQPGQSHKEDGNTYCNTQCAYDDRLSKQPIDKQLQLETQCQHYHTTKK